jgi:hypothetical protein
MWFGTATPEILRASALHATCPLQTFRSICLKIRIYTFSSKTSLHLRQSKTFHIRVSVIDIMDAIPADVAANIFFYLKELSELLQLRTVCRKWCHEYFEANVVWRFQLLGRLPQNTISTISDAKGYFRTQCMLLRFAGRNIVNFFPSIAR